VDFAEVFHKIYRSRLSDSSSPLRPRVSSLLAGWFMTYQLDVAGGRDIVARWCALAEQRLHYLTELFETGRWRRFHTELSFLENIQEAKAAVDVWRDLLSRGTSRDNSGFGMSRVGATAGPSNIEALRKQMDWVPQQPADVLSEPAPMIVAIVPQTTHLQPVKVHSVATMAPASYRSPNINSIAERYPLLRNSL
jgi:uncharacterized repeat protein (TIGR03809 family)